MVVVLNQSMEFGGMKLKQRKIIVVHDKMGMDLGKFYLDEVM
jgi:peptidyl-tRNA hydrolase